MHVDVLVIICVLTVVGKTVATIGEGPKATGIDFLAGTMSILTLNFLKLPITVLGDTSLNMVKRS